jgi:hypothetical protein
LSFLQGTPDWFGLRMPVALINEQKFRREFFD